MAISAISTTAFLADAVIYIRDEIRNVTDPISSTRNAKERFVLTAYPRRNVTYPIITVRSRGFNSIERGGFQSSVTINRLGIEIRVWARNVKERDELAQSSLDRLRSIQQTASTGSNAVRLFDFTIASIIDVDDIGEQGIKSKIIQVEYMVILGE